MNEFYDLILLWHLTDIIEWTLWGNEINDVKWLHMNFPKFDLVKVNRVIPWLVRCLRHISLHSTRQVLKWATYRTCQILEWATFRMSCKFRFRFHILACGNIPNFLMFFTFMNISNLEDFSAMTLPDWHHWLTSPTRVQQICVSLVEQRHIKL